MGHPAYPGLKAASFGLTFREFYPHGGYPAPAPSGKLTCNCNISGLLLWLAGGGVGGHGDGDVDGVDGAEVELVQAGLDLGLIADDQDGELVGVNVLFRGGFEIGNGHFFERGLVGFEVVGGVAVELKALALGEDLVAGVVAEEERVEDVVLGAGQLFVGEGAGVEAGYLGERCLGCVHG